MSENKFLELIKSQREKTSERKFRGTFLDYLEKVKENPDLAKLAHRRLYECLLKDGTEVLEESNERVRKIFDGDKVTTFNYFQKDFFGAERVISRVMQFLRAAAHKGEESRQILLLMGPVGAGKSALTEHIKRALEVNGGEYFSLEGCPVREEPLHLVPRSLRPSFEKILGIQIEGDLCPVCRFRLTNEYKNEYENFPVVQSSFSVRGRKGVGVVPPTDPNTQDISILIGSEDISK